MPAAVSSILVPTAWLQLLPAIVVAAVVAGGLWLAFWGLHRWLRQIAPRPESLRLTRNLLTVVAAAVVVLVLLRGEGWGAPHITWRALSDWAMGPGLHILFIFVGAFVLVRVTDLFIAHLQHVLAAPEVEARNWAERRKRIETAGRLLRGVATLVIAGIAILMALREVHVDITPILTGAGVIGVAVGLGAQTVVRDLIVGVFLILENQIRVGDVISINGKTGLVEALRLRIIVLRAEDGAVHIFHNGSINEYANLTKDYAFAVLDVTVPFQAELARVNASLLAVGSELAQDAAFAAKLAGPMEVTGIEALTATTMTVRIRQRTLPMEQWAVDRELRRRIHERFQQDRIALAAGS